MDLEETKAAPGLSPGFFRAQRAAPLQRLLVLALLGLLALAASAQTKKENPTEPLDLNAATIEELQKLPGVGPSIAKSIVRFREKSGPFRRVEELLAVRGITKARLEKLRPYITVKPKLQSLNLPSGAYG